MCNFARVVLSLAKNNSDAQCWLIAVDTLDSFQQLAMNECHHIWCGDPHVRAGDFVRLNNEYVPSKEMEIKHTKRRKMFYRANYYR